MQIRQVMQGLQGAWSMLGTWYKREILLPQQLSESLIHLLSLAVKVISQNLSASKM